jgi:2-polyprenyl-3-methyl-5-hydroxy-6-metoxy-1,4-benzoquinol methylase
MSILNENDKIRLKKTFDEAIEKHLYQYYWKSLGLRDWKIRVEARRNEVPFAKAVLQSFEKLSGISLKGKKMLDVGCGWGGYVVAASEMGANIYGCDIDEEVLEIAKLRARLHEVNSKYFCCQAEKLPFADEEFDCVLNWGVLEHVRDLSLTVKGIVRVLKKGGVGFIYAPNYWQPIENHYKVLFPPKCPKSLGKLYLRLLGRPAEFLDTINYIDHKMIKNEFKKYDIGIEDIERRFWGTCRHFYVSALRSSNLDASVPWTYNRLVGEAMKAFVRIVEITLNIRQICFVIRKAV